MMDGSDQRPGRKNSATFPKGRRGPQLSIRLLAAGVIAMPFSRATRSSSRATVSSTSGGTVKSPRGLETLGPWAGKVRSMISLEAPGGVDVPMLRRYETAIEGPASIQAVRWVSFFGLDPVPSCEVGPRNDRSALARSSNAFYRLRHFGSIQLSIDLRRDRGGMFEDGSRQIRSKLPAGAIRCAVAALVRMPIGQKRDRLGRTIARSCRRGGFWRR
jgi:hypothetical protein